MRVTIVTDVESQYVSEDEIKDNICSIVSDLLAQSREIGIEITVQEISYPANQHLATGCLSAGEWRKL